MVLHVYIWGNSITSLPKLQRSDCDEVIRILLLLAKHATTSRYTQVNNQTPQKIRPSICALDLTMHSLPLIQTIDYTSPDRFHHDMV